MARVTGGVKVCASRKIDESDLHTLTVRALNLARDEHQTDVSRLTECVSEALDTERAARIKALDAQIRELQEQLIRLRSGSAEEETLGEKIIRLRNEQNALCGSAALEAQRIQEIRDAAAAFAGMTEPLTEFDEQYVRGLIERVIVYEDRVVFCFKDGQEITIDE